jgi:hypothetical protein
MEVVAANSVARETSRWQIRVQILLTIAKCGTITPLGAPVEPEV